MSLSSGPRSNSKSEGKTIDQIFSSPHKGYESGKKYIQAQCREKLQELQKKGKTLNLTGFKNEMLELIIAEWPASEELLRKYFPKKKRLSYMLGCFDIDPTPYLHKAGRASEGLQKMLKTIK